MNIAIINIGDELLAGKVLNSNQQDLSRLLVPLGHRVRYGLVVGDEEAEIVAALDEALGRPGRADATVRPAARPPVDIVILTGGLGPTRDDLTRQAAAAWLGVPVVEDAGALAWLADFLRTDPASLPPAQRVQAEVPRGTRALRNPAGTACGFAFTSGDARVFAFPGVPRELGAMAALHLVPVLSGDRILLERGVWTWGWSESAQRDAFRSLAFPEGVRFSSLPGERGVRISLQWAVPAAEQARYESDLETAWSSLLAAIPPEHLVDAQGRSLPEAVFALLKDRGATLSVAESCTAGGLAFLLTETPGSSAVFERGFLTYADAAKTDLLGVPEGLLRAHGAVSEETARSMAAGCLERSGATLACAVTGIAGPDGGTSEKPVGTVWVAVASRQAMVARKFQFRGDRQAIRQRSAFSALNQIRLFLLEKGL